MYVLCGSCFPNIMCFSVMFFLSSLWNVKVFLSIKFSVFMQDYYTTLCGVKISLSLAVSVNGNLLCVATCFMVLRTLSLSQRICRYLLPRKSAMHTPVLRRIVLIALRVSGVTYRFS